MNWKRKIQRRVVPGRHEKSAPCEFQTSLWPTWKLQDNGHKRLEQEFALQMYGC